MNKAVDPSNIRTLLHHAAWALRTVWSTNARLITGQILLTVIRGLVPAGLALFARGLINAVVAILDGGAGGMEDVWPWLLFGFGLTLIEAVGPQAQKLFSQRLRDDLNLKITTDLLIHAATLDVAFFEDPRKQEMITRAQSGTADRFSTFVQEVLSTGKNLLQTLSLVAILMVIEPLVLVVLGPFALPYLIFQWRLASQRYSEEYSRVPKRRWTNYFVSTLTSQRSVPEVKMLDLPPLFIDRFRSLMTQFRDRDRRLHIRGFAGSTLFGVLTTVTFYAIFFRVVLKAISGALTVGDIAVFGGATSRLRATLNMAILSVSNAMAQTLYISNLIAFLEQKPKVVTKAAVIPTASEGELAFEKVSFTYPGSTTPTLKNISLHIKPGEIVGLVGENGAGKTTLVKLICRFYDPDQGVIRFNGVDLDRLPLAYLHQQIAFVLQGFGRYEATADENIAFGNWGQLLNDREAVERVARLSGVHDMIQAMPEGYDTVLGRMFGQYDLSGGQWQKLGVARAFSRDASLLILDEPTSNLDARSEYKLYCRFRELAQGRTTLLISHRFSTLSMADRLLVMDEGRIVESGTHHELLSRAGNYATLYDLHRRQMNAHPAG